MRAGRKTLLVELSIANFAIIERLRLEFGHGFSVLTGETGAGKSIIIDAMELLLGGRASTDMIRSGSESALVEGVFQLKERTRQQIAPLLAQVGLDSDVDELIMRRELYRDKRNTCRLNDRRVTLNTLDAIGRHLVDIHGQGEHLSLMQAGTHIDFLDQFGGLMDQRATFADQVYDLRRVRKELDGLRNSERETARRIDLLRYQIQEIEEADLRIGEEEALQRERKLLGNAEQRVQLAAQIYAQLSEGGRGQQPLVDLLDGVREQMTQLASLDDSLSRQAEDVENVYYQFEDLAREILDYGEAVDYDPRSLQELDDRLAMVHKLKRKYGDTIEEVLRFADRARKELEGITNTEERIEQLAARERELLAGIGDQGKELSLARQACAEDLSELIERQLADLNMPEARFLVDIAWEESAEGAAVDGRSYAFDAKGLDRVQFLIAPNLGEEPKPLVRIASGGETSRLMLAMKTVLSTIDPVPTLIFDEIDTGIGGHTGDIVGEKLYELSQDHQVFCVTHLAQIARYAQEHYRVAKQIRSERTVSLVERLEAKDRIEELAILLGGAATEATRRSAKELLIARDVA